MNQKLKRLAKRLSMIKPRNGFQQPDTTQGSVFYPCDCALCERQAKNKLHPERAICTTSAPPSGERKGFIWLLKELGKASFQQVKLPDTCVFRGGRPWCLLNCHKDGSLKLRPSVQKLSLTEIMKMFQKIVRNRKKPKAGSKPESSGKEVVLLRYTSKESDNENIDSLPLNQLGPIRLLSEKEFFDLMYQRPGSPVWKNIAYIQTVICSRSGIGDIVNVAYDPNFAVPEPVNFKELMMRHPRKYCKLITKRIAQTLYWNAGVQVTGMNAEFMVDDFSKIWFTHATDLYVQSVELPKRKPPPATPKEEVEALHRALDSHLKEKAHNPVYKKYVKMLFERYDRAKERAGVVKILEREQNLPEVEKPAVREFSYERSKSTRVTRTLPRSQLLNEPRTLKRINQFKRICN